MTNAKPVTRQALRNEFRKKRGSLSPKQQNTAAKNVFEQCLESTPLLKAQSVACYLANNGEIETQAIIEFCWQQQKPLLLPVLHPTNKGHLLFVEYCTHTIMKKNTFGINEPDLSKQKAWALADIDLLFLPLVAFDKQGNRLGMGGGYYDRTLGSVYHDSLSTKLFGLAHDCQLTDNLPVESWDVPLHGVVTPSQIFNFCR